MPAAEVEAAVFNRMRDVSADMTIRDEVLSRLDTGKNTLADELTDQRETIEHRIHVLMKEGNGLVSSISQMGGDGGMILPARLREIEIDLGGLRVEANEIDNRMRGLLEAVGRVSTAVGLLESFDELWGVLGPEERRDLMRPLVERIDVDLDGGKLELHLHDLAAPFPPLLPPPQESADAAETEEVAS